MAFTTDDWRLQIRGDLPGGEIWVNTWCVQATDPGSEIQDAADVFHAFYVALEANFHNTLWTHVGCTAKNLSSGAIFDLDWVGGSGNDGDDSLPNQDGIRISLSALPQRRGGPFLPGWDLGALTSTGMLNNTAVTALVAALEDVRDDLATANFALAIESPTDLVTSAVTMARVGNRFDVIRKRANSQAESYTAVVF